MINSLVEKVFSKVSGKNICIIGDIMLDIYLFGDVSRISPEAPVQVFEQKTSTSKLGGASNVALNVKTLGANPYLVGVIGKDEHGKKLIKEMENIGMDTEGIIQVEDRPTTSKTRVIASSHHLIRIDSESKRDINKNIEQKIIQYIKSNIKKFDSIILEDYNKGVLTKSLIPKIIELANKNRVKILVDPKFDNFFEYQNVFLFKPNRKELEDAFGLKAKNDDEINKLCVKLIERINCKNLVLTMGEQGMKLFMKTQRGIEKENIKTRARKVADVSGAGDTVISTLSVCLSAGIDIKDAVTIANIAAGLVVEEVGIVPIFKENLIEFIRNDN
ncbi:MAG: D-glycero-beta-D-manno-heptose-7-phosphate kinase [Ignavibacteria bacterium]|nr:D-glycero-beta-D-manno-heptose-7-phosphate kinase [Ignavibacteria bacterium]